MQCTIYEYRVHLLVCHIICILNNIASIEPFPCNHSCGNFLNDPLYRLVNFTLSKYVRIFSDDYLLVTKSQYYGKF